VGRSEPAPNFARILGMPFAELVGGLRQYFSPSKNFSEFAVKQPCLSYSGPSSNGTLSLLRIHSRPRPNFFSQR
jgi:hypothetical protein